MKATLFLLAGLFLVSCTDGRMTGARTCMPDGSVVWWQYKNASGNYDGAKADPKYCKQRPPV